jgi:uncharacterized membrane protein (DUF373 family)
MIDRRREKGISIADTIASLGEGIIAALLLFILFMGIASFVLQIFTSFTYEVYTLDAIKKLIDKALILFIILELYVITISYIKREPVIKEVFIAAFIAIGRKILIYDYEKWGILGAAALSVLLFSVAFSYYLLYRISFGCSEVKEK